MKYLRYLAYGIGGLLLIVAVGYALVSYLVHARMTAEYHPSLSVPEVKPTPELIERGRHVARIRGCRDCHGMNYGGKVFIDDPMMGRYAGSNLTSGDGGIASRYDVDDWVRAIRHGIGPDGKPLVFMPSYEYDTIGNRDLAGLIAFLESRAPVDNLPPSVDVGPMSKVLYLSGSLPQLVSAERIDHTASVSRAPEPSVSVKYGRYIATSCTGCHGKTLSGGPIPGVPPSWPKASNLTFHESGLKEWTFSDFETLMRTGRTPSGDTVASRYMPWKNFRHMSDTEVRAVWVYLESLKTRPTAD